VRGEVAGAALLIIVGVGSRLLFVGAFPTLAFWDSLQLIHFAELIRSNGVAAPGWYWGQFNPGLPMILALILKLHLPVVTSARFATALVTGLLGLAPFLIWRGVVAFRWRLVAGLLLALWPGQIVFSGVVVQDNWVLPPMVLLACLAVRRLRSATGRAWPLSASVLFVMCFAIRQEMIIALLPLAIASGISNKASGRRARDVVAMAAVLGTFVALLCLQRWQATGRFTLATEHGALGLFGSFMPGAGTEGWIDARPYAAARDPSAQQGLFGSPGQLLRLTAEEVERRPAFHALRIIAWLPRLALDADADALHWSMGVPQSLTTEIRPRADAFLHYARPLSVAVLALIQGAFVAALLIGIRRRRSDILLLASAVALKFAIHMVVSPLGRLVLPAVALELLAIPLGAAELAHLTSRQRARILLVGAGTAAMLLLLTPPLAGLVARLDSRELVGIHSFRLDAGRECAIHCEVLRGEVIGLTPNIAAVRNAELACFLPLPPQDARLELRVEGAPVDVIAERQVLQPFSERTYLIRSPGEVSRVGIESTGGGITALQFRITEQNAE
jgi:hypothetical protein